MIDFYLISSVLIEMSMMFKTQDKIIQALIYHLVTWKKEVVHII